MDSASSHATIDCASESELASIIDQIHDALAQQEPIDLNALLQSHAEHASEIRQLYPAMRAVAVHADEANCGDQLDAIPRTLGDYRILREVGRGGMGVVYEAEQISLHRQVAIKVLPLAAMFDRRQLQRFKNEAAAAASLHHENIVPVYALECVQSVHFYAMQFVPGETVAELIEQLQHEKCNKSAAIPPCDDGRSLSYFQSVARVGQQVATALDYAHQHGVVHRDIKPSNLIVDRDGKVWVTDFGLARYDCDAQLTISGDLLGTLRYMSPEQTVSKRQMLDHRTDIYSLGATLYEMMTLHPAFASNDRAELIEQIRNRSPRSPRKVQPAVPQQLENAIGKAMAKEPGERYATAQALADDLGRFLAGKLVLARRPSVAQHATRWTRRHSLHIALALIVATAFMAMFAAIAYKIATLHRRAEQNAQRFFQQRQRAAVIAARLHVGRGSERLEQRDATGLLHLVRAIELVKDLPQQQPLLQLWADWRAQFDGHLSAVVGHDGPVNSLAIHPDDQFFVTAGDDDMVRVWSLPSAKPVTSPRRTASNVLHVAFDAGGKRLAAGLANGTAVVWSVDDGFEIEHVLEHGEGGVRNVRFDPSGNRLVTASNDGQSLRIWDMETGLPWQADIPQKRDEYDFDISPNGDLLACGNAWAYFGIWNLDKARRRFRPMPHPNSVRFVRFLDDSKKLLTTCMDKHHHIRLWSTDDAPRLLHRFACHGLVTQVAVHEGAKLIVAGTANGKVWLYDYNTKQAMQIEKLHRTHIDALAISQDAQLLATCCRDGTARLWDLRTREPVGPWIRHQDSITAAEFTHDGNRLITTSRDGTTRIHDATFTGPAFTLPPDSGGSNICFSQSSDILAAVIGRHLKLWDCRNQHPRLIRTISELDDIASFAIHPDGNMIATATSKHMVRCWSVQTGEMVKAPLVFGDWVRSVAYSHDGKLLAVGTGSFDRTIRCYDAQTLAAIGMRPVECQSGVAALDFSPLANRLAAGTHHGLILIDDARPPHGLQRHLSHQSVRALQFDPTGTWLAVGLRGPKAILLNCASGEMSAVMQHGGPVTAVAYHPSSQKLATASSDGYARIWHNLHSATPSAVYLKHPDGINGVAFHPRGKWLATTCRDGRIRLWPQVTPPTSLAEARAKTLQAVAARLVADERMEAVSWNVASIGSKSQAK